MIKIKPTTLILSLVNILGSYSLAGEKIEVISDPAKPNSYSVCISLSFSEAQEERIKFAKKVQETYDDNELSLTYIDEGKFWQNPHVTIAMFEKVKLENISKFQVLFEKLKKTNIPFQPRTYSFFGQGDQLVAIPNTAASAKIKVLNSQIIDWVGENIESTHYKIARNNTKKKFKPHLSLNTSVKKNLQVSVREILCQTLNATVVNLGQVIITATNQWS